MGPYLSTSSESGTLTSGDPVAQGLIDDLGDAVVVIDEHQRLVAFNRAAGELFGYEPADLLGERLDVLLPADAVDGHHALVAAFGAGTDSMRSMSDRKTLFGRRSDGTEFPIEITIAKSQPGDHVLFTAVIRDVTKQRQEEGQLEATIDHFVALTEHDSSGVVVVCTDGRILYASPLLATLTGLTKESLAGTVARDLLHPDDYEAHRPALATMADTPGHSVNFECRCRRPDGRWVWVEATTTNMVDDPRVGGFVINFRDITLRRVADAQREAVAELGLRALAGTPFSELAHDTAALLVDLFDADSAAILERKDDDEASMVVRACVGWPQGLVGDRVPAPPESRMGRTLMEAKPVIVADYATEPDFPGKEMIDDAGIRSSVGVSIGGGDDDAWGLIRVLSDQPAHFTDTDADFVQVIANVLASALARDRSQAETSRQALHDPLTGLPNRALLNDRVELGLAGAHRSPDSRLMIHFIDLDGFKRLNDTLGHEAGDELLRQVGQRLRATVRAEETVARFGGDEFVVVTRTVPDSPSPLASTDRILQALRRPYDTRGGELFMTASIGVVVSSHAEDTVDHLLRDADAAMYEAKERGGDRYVLFDNDVRAQLTKRSELEEDLRCALDRDELCVYYQPIVDSTGGQTLELEALLRWEHPERGLIGPVEFIPIAEDTGLILPIGRWVLQRACRQLARWQRDHHRPDLAVSVNLSPCQLTDPQLVASVRHSLETSGIAPSTLRLEITESMVVQDLDRAAGTLESIAELGVGITIDNFGTGYSSLTYLKKLPILCIKIDRSFVTDICTDPVDRAIVGVVNQLTSELGISAVVGGVETPEQLAAVRELGCTVIQGFFYSQPLRASDVDAWLERRTHPVAPDQSPDPRPDISSVTASSPST